MCIISTKARDLTTQINKSISMSLSKKLGLRWKNLKKLVMPVLQKLAKMNEPHCAVRKPGPIDRLDPQLRKAQQRKEIFEEMIAPLPISPLADVPPPCFSETQKKARGKRSQAVFKQRRRFKQENCGNLLEN